MPDGIGTIAAVASEIAKALAPLEERLISGKVNTLFLELGMNFPPQLAADGGVANALSQGINAVAALPALLSQLESAASAGDTGQIISATTSLIQAIAAVLSALDTIASAINAMANSLPGLSPGDVAAFASDLTEALIGFVVVTYLEGYYPRLRACLVFLGVIEESPQNSSSTDPAKPPYVRRRLHVDSIPNLLKSPDSFFQSQYGWGTPSFDGNALFDQLADLLYSFVIPAQYTRPTPTRSPSIRVFLFSLTPNPALSPPGLRLTTDLGLQDGFTLSFPFFIDGWSIQVSGKGALLAGLTADITPPSSLVLRPPSGSVDGQLWFQLVAGPTAPATNVPIFNVVDSVLAQAAGMNLGVGVDFNWDATSGTATGDLALAGGITQGQLVIRASDVDSFLASLLPQGGITAGFNLPVGWSGTKGLYFIGGAALETTVALGLSLGPVTISTLYIVTDISISGRLSLEASLGANATLGPIAVAVDRLGALATLAFKRGNLGVADLSIDPKPPNGLGIQIDAGVFAGGGYISFDPATGQYAGVLDVTLAEIVAVKVIGVLDTRLPDGSSSYSFLLIITFNLPPIQLGFGFTLSGVGGLGGVNRTMVQDALRAGLRAHTLDDILFPSNPIANAPQIISDIESFFPPQQGRYLFGPMVQIGWGELNLVEFALGIILEVPDPVRLAILGEITVAIPDPDAALISFKIDVLGTIDFGLDKIAIDGTMYDSYVLWFQISGDMAFRLNWGANPEFLLSLGGFNPKFQPPPNVPVLQRLSVSLGSGSNPRFSSNSYFAVTSNTLQFGANVDAYASAGGFSVHGYIGWDALFTFSPFSFEIDFSAGFDISYDGASLAGIQLTASLSGPQPWHLHGSASFNILFFSVSATIDLSWGDSIPPTVLSQPVMPPLLAALGDPRNWSVTLPPANSQTVSLRTIAPDAGTIVVHPLGSLSVRETIVPLDITITKFNSVAPSDGNEFQISAVTVNGAPADTQPLQEDFAIAQFTDMSDADKLSAPSYELFDAGVTLGAIPIESGDDSARTVTYQERYIDDYNALSRFGSIYEMPANVHSVLVRSGLAAVVPSATTGLRAYIQTGMKSPISVSDIAYAVASTSDLTARTDVLASNATHYAAATALRAFIAANPDQQGAVQVVTAHEVAI